MTTILLVEDDEMNKDMLSRRLMKKGYEVISSGVEMVPKNMTKVSGDQSKTLLLLLNLLEEHDDIQNIYSNVEFDESDL